MSDYFSTLLFWHWWVLGLVLVVVEMVAPGFFLLWIGLAAGVTGLILFIVPGMGWEVQFVLFGVLALGLGDGRPLLPPPQSDRDRRRHPQPPRARNISGTSSTWTRRS